MTDTADLLAFFRTHRIAVQAGGCWNWTGSIDRCGYGRVGRLGLPRMAHRAIYALTRGIIAPGLDLDHLCRNPACVNPDHLEPVAHKENMRRGTSPVAVHAAKTHCIKGHEFTAANTLRRRNGWRGCKTCKRIAGPEEWQRYKKKHAPGERKGTGPTAPMDEDSTPF